MEYDLHLPVGTKDVYLDRLKSIPEDKRASWRFHTVKPGESLEGIASSLHARASEIAETNGISLGDTVEPGDELVIPLASISGGTGHVQHYTMKRSDTLITVADRFNVSPEDLRKWNHLSSGTVKAGRVLAVSEPVQLAPSMRARGRGARTRKAASGGKSSRSRESIGQTRHAPQHAGAASKASSVRHAGKKAATRTTKATANSSSKKRKAAR
jgi:membrane-bound lytic murein transglycosylase D